MSEIKPCIFCGYDRPRTEKTRLDAEGRYYVYCPHCEARGSEGWCADVAIELWNDAWKNEAIYKKIKLEPCPHCGESDDLIVDENNGGNFNVLCQNCGARGGLERYKYKAIEKWNRRADE